MIDSVQLFSLLLNKDEIALMQTYLIVMLTDAIKDGSFEVYQLIQLLKIQSFNSN